VFGKVENENMILNQYGKIAKDKWREIPEHYDYVDIDIFVIMPNHIHGIIIIKPQKNDTIVGTEHCSVPTNKSKESKNYGLLSKVIKSFKNTVTKDIKEISPNKNFRWQRSFYDHVIRTDESLEEIRRYIEQNPLKWELDENNPSPNNPPTHTLP
jgi:REP element-mobilizing transposase RayT